MVGSGLSQQASWLRQGKTIIDRINQIITMKRIIVRAKSGKTGWASGDDAQTRGGSASADKITWRKEGKLHRNKT